MAQTSGGKKESKFQKKKRHTQIQRKAICEVAFAWGALKKVDDAVYKLYMKTAEDTKAKACNNVGTTCMPNMLMQRQIRSGTDSIS